LAGVFFSAVVVLLTFMGTPAFGIQTPPAQRILSRFVPATEPGPLRELPWDQLRTGPKGEMKTYFVSYPEGWDRDPRYADRERYEFVTDLVAGEEDQLRRLLMQLKADVENEPRLVAPVYGDQPLAVVTIQLYQPKLKWIEMTVNWDEFEHDAETDRQTLKRLNRQRVAVAVHQEAAYGE
jgi:hypothetical protein